jgi:hypothetical protein
MAIDTGWKMGRRPFLRSAAGLAAGGGLSASALGDLCPVKEGTVRDRLWVFCNPINADFEYVRKRSVMSPFENAVYLGIPNIIMVNQYPGPGQESWYKPWESPFEPYAFPLKLQKRVAWSIVGASGVTHPEERREVLAMAHSTPNIVGVFLDDFFSDEPGKVASLTIEEVKAVQRGLKTGGKKLDLFVTLYTEALDRPIGDYLKLIDVITLWTGPPAELAHLDANVAKLEKLSPGVRILLGCYTADYLQERTPMWLPLPVATMQYQCELGLKWLRQGRIEGIIIYGNFCDLGWPSTEWAREWVRKVGDTKI